MTQEEQVAQALMHGTVDAHCCRCYGPPKVLTPVCLRWSCSNCQGLVQLEPLEKVSVGDMVQCMRCKREYLTVKVHP